MAYAAAPGYDPVVMRVQRLFSRKLSFADITLDLIVGAALLLVVSVQKAMADALFFDQLNDAFTSPAWWKIFMPPIINGALLVWIYTTVMYHLFPLLSIYIIIAVLLGLVNFVFIFWMTIDWFNCKNVLWCANLSYWTTDPVSHAKIFGPLINGSARWVFIVYWVTSALAIVGIGVMIYLAITLFNVLWYRNRALQAANSTLPITDNQDVAY